MTDADLLLTGRFEPGEARQYRHVPFMVPPGTDQIQIAITYDGQISSGPFAEGGNTLDVGLFDERGVDAGGSGFRGWSGSERLTITIAERWATPPYRPGPIGAGTWHLLLGPYKVSPAGLTYRAEVRFNPDLAPETAPPGEVTAAWAPTVPPAAEPGWVRGDLHCHSVYSDGDAWPVELLHAARARGLDFLAITDHNGAVHHDPPARDLPLLVPGVEVTTYRGHWNVWGLSDWFDFRDPTDANLAAEMHRATAAGGVVCINHPRPFGPDWSPGLLRGADIIEVWNGHWERLNVVALAKWDVALSAGQRLIAVGGSDAHHLHGGGADPLPPALGEPTTWVQIEGSLSVATLLDGIRAGRCFVSASPSGPQLYIDRHGDVVSIRTHDAKGGACLVIGNGNIVAASAITSDAWSTSLAWPVGCRYLRAQLVDGLGRVYALSNALFPDETIR